MNTKELINRYRKYFLFLQQDTQPVAIRQNRNLIIASIVFFILNLSVFFIEFIANSATVNDLPLYNFYFVHMFAALFNIFLAVIFNKINCAYKFKTIPVYVANIVYVSLNISSLFANEIDFFSSAMTFADFEIVSCLLFDLNPIFVTVSVFIVNVIYMFKCSVFLQIANITVFCILIIALGWWKRISRVRGFYSTFLIKKEKQKNEELLLNILPPAIVEELKATGKAKPEFFESVSVMFTDFQGFTSITKDLSPDFIISELNDIFTNFDRISEEHGCTRIKTIGDSYFSVCGLPTRDKDHAKKLVLCGKDFIKYLEQRNETSQIKWFMRVGINSGTLTAGIVGTKKYLYDIFGDTVNTASRMESNSEPMRINISEATRNLLGDEFSFEKREPAEVKGKGKMNMYFVK